MNMKHMLVICLVVGIIDLAVSLCPNGTTAQGSFCFFIGKSRATYSKAFMYCQAYGCNLAIPDTVEKQAALSTYLNSLPRAKYFFGATDELSEDTWVKVPSGEVWTNITFADGEPNGGASDNCLSTGDYINWEMRDISCSAEYEFVCECQPIN